MVLITLVIFSFSDLSAYPNGITGRTKKTSSQGCGSCHNSGTGITGIITGPDSVLAGQTVTFTLTLTSTSGSGKYGVDIAAKNGTLAVVSGSGLKLSSGELTQSSAITYVSPKLIDFSYTAPSSAGTDTLYATVDRGHSGQWAWAPNKGIKVYTLSGISNNEIPVKFYLSQNYPNPFNPVTKINFGIARSSNVKVTVYNLLGKETAVLVNDFHQAGNYYVNFDASKLSSGIYYYRIDAGEFTEVKKMTLVK
ncbi:MAG: T9SS type A sorting domain-containing protein [Ignavibacteria bacterium]|nr:T9SS type A sorting domain-containing protein [Ignavibacteria bacterium]